MRANASHRRSCLNRIFVVMAAIGLCIAILGIAFDYVPGASPGLDFPQLLMIVGGLLAAGIGLLLRRPQARYRLAMALKKHLVASLAIAALTLLALEVVFALAGQPTYFPSEVPENFLDPVPWWTCDEAGCHYVYEALVAACDNGELSDLRCIVNRQGYHDTQDFVIAQDFDDRLRVLVLGDSFAFGGSAEFGKSFVETVERNIIEAVVWNTAIPGAGTNQALMTFNVYAPLLQPQVTILGFYMNDFDDNMMPVDSYFMGVDAEHSQLSIRQYQIDLRGNVIKLDRQSDLFYRYHLVDPPVSELHRMVGTTRLGSLGLRALDAVQQMISKAEGTRVNRRVAVTEDYLRSLREAAARAETQLLVLLIPRREDIAAPGPLYQNALRLLKELEIPFLDPRDLLSSDSDYARLPDVHWSSAGHIKIGERLTQCLQDFQSSRDIARCQS